MALFSLFTGWLSGPVVLAQNDSSENLSNVMFEAATVILSNAAVQASDLVSTNESLSNNTSQAEEESNATLGPADTNALPRSVQPGPSESRRDWLQRHRAGAPGTNLPDSALHKNSATNEAASEFRPLKPDYSKFKLITERNIFDPNRQPYRSGGPRTKRRTIDSFALVGVMSYDKGTFAFFDGSSSDYRKTVKLSDSIAGFKVTDITPNAIQLAAGTNHVELHVGMQLRREEGGGWLASSQAEAYSASASSGGDTKADTKTGTKADTNNAVSTAGSGAGDDVIERLRKRREQE